MKLLAVLFAAAMLTGCTANPDRLQGTWSDGIPIETKGNPARFQLLALGSLDSGVYRYLDKETGVVVYVIREMGTVGITSQKIGGGK